MAGEQPDLCTPPRIRRQKRPSVNAPPASRQQPLIGGPSKTTWRVEYEPTSLAAVDCRRLVPGPGGTGGSQARLRFGLVQRSGGAPGTRRSSWILAAGLAGNDRLVFTGARRAAHAISVSPQLRIGSWKLAAVRLPRHGGSGAHRVLRRPDARRRRRHGPASTRRNPSPSCSWSMPSTPGPARRAACGSRIRRCSDELVVEAFGPAVRCERSTPCR